MASDRRLLQYGLPTILSTSGGRVVPFGSHGVSKQIDDRTSVGRGTERSRSGGRKVGDGTSIWIICLSTLKHGNEHSKQAISDTTQGATVVMTDLAQARVVMFAARVVLDTGTSPMIEGVA